MYERCRVLLVIFYDFIANENEKYSGLLGPKSVALATNGKLGRIPNISILKCVI